MKKFAIAAALSLMTPTQALAQGMPKMGIGTGLFLSIVYGLVGIALLMIGYKIFEWITPFSVNDALSKDQNRAVGIVVGAIFLAVGLIVAAALG